MNAAAQGKGAPAGGRRRVTCNEMAAKGLCPFVKAKVVGLPAEARDACTKAQGLTKPASESLMPVTRVRPRLIEVEMETEPLKAP